MSLKNQLNCKEGWRCKKPLLCHFCAKIWQKRHFKAFAQTLVHRGDDSITYMIVKSNSLNTLGVGIEDCYKFLGELKELKKRDKICDFYSRLEVSFGVNQLGFNPHINIVFFGSINGIKEIAQRYNLGVWHRKKENDRDTILSIVWYMLKFNDIGLTQGEAVATALKKRRTILHTKRFNYTLPKDSDELIDMDFSFLGTYSIRSKEEVSLREEIREKRRAINSEFKQKMESIV